MENWYYLKNNKVSDPTSIEKMKEILTNNKSVDQILVKRSPLKKWYRLSELSRFKVSNKRFNEDFLAECRDLYSLYQSMEIVEPVLANSSEAKIVDVNDAIDRFRINVENEIARNFPKEKKVNTMIAELAIVKYTLANELQNLRDKITEKSSSFELPKLTSFSGRVRQILEG